MIIDLTPARKLRQFTADAVRYILREILLVDLRLSLAWCCCHLILFSVASTSIALSERMAYAVALFVMMPGTLALRSQPLVSW
jgi:uncharacterized membrane protein YiaA